VHDLTALGILGHGQHLEFCAADIFQVRVSMIAAHWETVDTGPPPARRDGLSARTG